MSIPVQQLGRVMITPKYQAIDSTQDKYAITTAIYIFLPTFNPSTVNVGFPTPIAGIADEINLTQFQGTTAASRFRRLRVSLHFDQFTDTNQDLSLGQQPVIIYMPETGEGIELFPQPVAVDTATDKITNSAIHYETEILPCTIVRMVFPTANLSALFVDGYLTLRTW